MRNLSLYLSTYNKLREVKDKLYEVVKRENIRKPSYSKVLETCWRVKRGKVDYKADYEKSGEKKAISVNVRANQILATMRYQYEVIFQRTLPFDHAIYLLLLDMVSELEIDSTILAKKLASYKKTDNSLVSNF